MIDLMAQRSCQPDQVHLTIRLGVTGHRLLPDHPRLAAAVHQALEKHLWELFDEKTRDHLADPAHTPVYFSIVTSLAEGADRLVAREILRYPHASLEAVLPLTEEDYLDDFPDSDSAAEFKQLLNLAHRRVVLQPAHLKEQIQDEDQLTLARKQAYLAAGHYMVNHCDVLIALWDGRPANGLGGTAEIVAYAQTLNCPIVIISTDDGFPVSIVPGQGLNGELLAGIEAFNAYHITDQEKKIYEENVFRDLFDNPFADALAAEDKQEVKETLIPVYVRSSLVAKHHQKVYRRTGFLVYLFSAGAVASVAIGTLYHSLFFPAYLLELLLLLLIITLVCYMEHKHSHRHWYENRFFSERLRSAFFFVSCGLLPERIEMPAYLHKAWQHDWMFGAFESVCQRLSGGRHQNPHSVAGKFDFIGKKWLQEQVTYHEAKAEKLQPLNHRLERLAFFFFLAAMGSAALHLALHFVHFHWAHEIEKVLTFCAISLPAFGAAVGGIKAHRDYGRLTMQSRNQAMALRALEHHFPRCRDYQQLQSLLHEIDKIMLAETEDWLNLVRFLKLEAAA